MKYLYLILLTGLLSCSKSKESVNNNTGAPLSFTAQVIEVKWWAVILVTDKPLTTTGTASLKWDVYNSTGSFLYEKTADISYVFNNKQVSEQFKTTVQGATTMEARNMKIVSITDANGNKFKY